MQNLMLHIHEYIYGEPACHRCVQDELGVARDLFNALQSFYRTFPHFQQRPVIITGEVSRFLLQAGDKSTVRSSAAGKCCMQAFHVSNAGT